MSRIARRSAGVAALSAVVLGLAGCGESSEEKATKQVCAATTEISTQIKKLESLPVSTGLVTEIKTSAEAIDKSVGEIKSAVPNLPEADKQEFEVATRAFQLELASLIATTIKSSASGEAALKSAAPQVKASLRKLGTDYKHALESLNCS
ncbi:MAG TPA: hypothetical protein VMI13_14220 [Solirubrobacteraceae bacterium]|nr:hypothetical protein [Solirubrobacteraceae bacterium]